MAGLKHRFIFIADDMRSITHTFFQTLAVKTFGQKAKLSKPDWSDQVQIAEPITVKMINADGVEEDVIVTLAAFHHHEAMKTALREKKIPGLKSIENWSQVLIYQDQLFEPAKGSDVIQELNKEGIAPRVRANSGTPDQVPDDYAATTVTPGKLTKVKKPKDHREVIQEAFDLTPVLLARKAAKPKEPAATNTDPSTGGGAGVAAPPTIPGTVPAADATPAMATAAPTHTASTAPPSVSASPRDPFAGAAADAKPWAIRRQKSAIELGTEPTGCLPFLRFCRSKSATQVVPEPVATNSTSAQTPASVSAPAPMPPGF